MISLIVAKAKNNAIGKDNDLLWHISEDLKFFKRTTSGHPIIMGYNTFLSLNSKPLPNRRNIVLTSKKIEQEGVEFFNSLEASISACTTREAEEEIFIIGGGQIYKVAMEFVQKLYITEVDLVIDDADTFFPEIDLSVWEEISRTEKIKDEKSGIFYSFVCYSRKNN